MNITHIYIFIYCSNSMPNDFIFSINIFGVGKRCVSSFEKMSSLLQNTSNAPVLVINPRTWNVINTLTKIEVAGISFGNKGIESFKTFDKTYKIINVTSINTTEYHILVRVSLKGCGSPITTTFLKFF